MRGSAEAIRYAVRDLATLNAAMGHVDRVKESRRCCVQAGGCLGVFPKHLSRSFDVVYTFEPDPVNFGDLCFNAPEPNIVKMQLALGSRAGLTSIVYGRRDGDETRMAHAGVTHIDGPGYVPVIPLDALMLKQVDLLVLDLEGCELEALQGAGRVIQENRPVIMVEINNMIEARGYQQEDLRTHLRMLNYERVDVLRSDEIYVPASERKT